MRQPDYCFYCHGFIRPMHLTRDHFIPRSKRGSDRSRNIVPACRSCNVAKGNLNPIVAFNLYRPIPRSMEDEANLERLRATVRCRAAHTRHKGPFADFANHPAVRYGDMSVRITDLMPELVRLSERAD